MLVIVRLSRLVTDKLTIRVNKPQHDSNDAQEYSLLQDARIVLERFGIDEEIINSHFELLAQMGVNERLAFPPMDVPQDDLRRHGFRLQSPASAVLVTLLSYALVQGFHHADPDVQPHAPLHDPK